MNTKKKLIIVGGGALGREVYQYALDMIAAEPAGLPFDGVAGFLDDAEDVAGQLRQRGVDFEFFGPIDGHLPRENCVYVLAVGSAKERRMIRNRLDRRTEWAAVFHPSAYVHPTAVPGQGIVLAPFAFVGANAQLGDHTVLNTYASCGHDSKTGACCVLSPYAVINGSVELGDEVFMGTHATVIPGLTVGQCCSLSAGAVVVRNVEPGFFMLGNPAKGWRMYDDAAKGHERQLTEGQRRQSERTAIKRMGSQDPKDGVYVMGAGGHANVVVRLLQELKMTVAAIFDDDRALEGQTLLGAPVLGSLERIADHKPLPTIIAIGDNDLRQRIAARFDCDWLSVVHPTAYVDAEVTIGQGTVVFAGAVIQPGTRLGDHVIVNTGATVDHDCTIGSYSHIAPGVHIAGDVSIGERVLFGIGATVIPGVQIGSGTTVGAGAAVVCDLPDGVVATGVPARVRR